jgi:hypothetical protein
MAVSFAERINEIFTKGMKDIREVYIDYPDERLERIAARKTILGFVEHIAGEILAEREAARTSDDAE